MVLGQRPTANGQRILALLLLVALVAFRIEPRLVRVLFQRAAYARYYAGVADRLWPQYPRFLEGVRAHTQPGDTIAIVVPTLDWDNGYSYAYYRASYLLSSREILPLSDSENHLQLLNFRDARYVAVWNTPMPQAHFTTVWRGEGGVLLRR
jgi:hypothetical protein